VLETDEISMSSRFEDHRPTAQAEQVYAETRLRFMAELKQFTASREAVERLEWNLAKAALAANMAASRPTPAEQVILADDGAQWCKSVDLMENIYLCHRATAGGPEYAVVRHFPERGTNEIWNWGWNAVEVLRIFAHEQRLSLHIWTDDMTAQIKKFLAEKYGGQEMSRVADGFMQQFTNAVSPQHLQSHEPSGTRDLRS